VYVPRWNFKKTMILGACTNNSLKKYVDIVNAELIESTLKQTIMCSCFNDFLWFSKYEKYCVHLIFIDCFIWLWNFKKTMISGACTNNGSKIKLSTNRGHITFPWIWGLTGITFARRKSITIARKIYLRLFFFTFARITCYLEYIWFTH
jgi:hypothetical protein